MSLEVGRGVNWAKLVAGKGGHALPAGAVTEVVEAKDGRGATWSQLASEAGT